MLRRLLGLRSGGLLRLAELALAPGDLGVGLLRRRPGALEVA
ncbi:hypothetical protein ACIRQF_07135 [Streptomyces sp. NPDC101191]